MSGGEGVTPDGSPVEVYTRLSPRGEPELIHAALPRGADILELGAGAGRVTHPLLALGHRVTAVDQSPEMLARIRGAETVLADIETLDLGRRFAGVVLASHFINVGDAALRQTFLDVCRRHVTAAGSVLIERYDPDFDWASAVGNASEVGDVVLTVEEATREGTKLSATVSYRVDGRTWHQSFEAEILDDGRTLAALESAGLTFARWLDDRRTWLEAKPLGSGTSNDT